MAAPSAGQRQLNKIYNENDTTPEMMSGVSSLVRPYEGERLPLRPFNLVDALR